MHTPLSESLLATVGSMNNTSHFVKNYYVGPNPAKTKVLCQDAHQCDIGPREIYILASTPEVLSYNLCLGSVF